MSAPKHTPGPWWSAEDPFDSGDHSTLVVVRDAVGRETWLARCEHNWKDADHFERRISWAEAEANARLIAAAPDLLDEARTDLQAWQNVLEFNLLPPTHRDTVLARIGRLRTAIAKATGAA